MPPTKPTTDFKTYYTQIINRSKKQAWFWAGAVALLVGGFWYFDKPEPGLMLALVLLAIIYVLHRHYTKRYRRRIALLSVPIPAHWQPFLEDNATFYANLSQPQKDLFNRRVQFFLAEKKIEGIGTDLDENLTLLVAASAIIPTFAFPFFEYPNLRQVLLYPNSFDRQFQTSPETDGGEEPRNIAGMVGNGFMNGTLLLSKPDLLEGFKGKNPHNVGIHEFVHLLDMADGAVDGLPEIFVNNAYAVPWLQVIKDEVRRIRKGRSDINPYSLTNNAEFLAVVSEYFFDNPEQFAERHPELYQSLCTIFHQDPGKAAK